jgi:hypothetical protein
MWCHRNGERLTNLVRRHGPAMARNCRAERQPITCQEGLNPLKTVLFGMKALGHHLLHAHGQAAQLPDDDLTCKWRAKKLQGAFRDEFSGWPSETS